MPPMKLIRPDEDVFRGRIAIPAEFWGPGLGSKDYRRICKTSCITGRQLHRLWKMLKRTDPLPDRLDILVRAEDVLRAFPPKIDHA